jgi:hypothetical protein
MVLRRRKYSESYREGLIRRGCKDKLSVFKANRRARVGAEFHKRSVFRSGTFRF